MISELMDGEEPAALHRYYSFEGEIIGTPLNHLET